MKERQLEHTIKHDNSETISIRSELQQSKIV